MKDIEIRIEGHAGHITLQRPDALNALTYDMALAIEAALDAWRDDDQVTSVIIDAEGDKAFCAGGDIVDIYKTASAGDFSHARQFWTDEYRLNAKIFEYPKPYLAFMQGFTMGGGVGISCHGSHRIVSESSQIAMPECGIGLVPDVGGSLLLALAPGRLGEYLGTTTTRMKTDDAIFAGFADHFVPEEHWPALKADLVAGLGADAAVAKVSQSPETGTLRALQPEIDAHFGGETLADIVRALKHSDSDFAKDALKKLSRVSPLGAACAVELIHRARTVDSIRKALELEYRCTYRAVDDGDFVEGIRALVIDKDKSPQWKHDSAESVPDIDVARMLMPLGDNILSFAER